MRLLCHEYIGLSYNNYNNFTAASILITANGFDEATYILLIGSSMSIFLR